MPKVLILTVSSVGQLLTVLLIFVFVLALTYFSTRLIAGFQKEKSTGNNVEILETDRISQNKFIQLIRIGDRYFALAVSKDTVTLISEIDESSLNFKDRYREKLVFKDFFNKAKEEKENVDNEEIP